MAAREYSQDAAVATMLSTASGQPHAAVVFATTGGVAEVVAEHLDPKPGDFLINKFIEASAAALRIPEPVAFTITTYGRPVIQKVKEWLK